MQMFKFLYQIVDRNLIFTIVPNNKELLFNLDSKLKEGPHGCIFIQGPS
jgi:hypothetical protein